MNEKLITTMAKCDGTKKNCEGCMYSAHPECRNALARHAAAALKLDEVLLENQRHVQQAITDERDYLREAAASQEIVIGMYQQMTGRIAEELHTLKHCETCLHKGEPVSEGHCLPDACVECSTGESRWLLAKRLQPDDPRESKEDAGAKPVESSGADAEG